MVESYSKTPTGESFFPSPLSGSQPWASPPVLLQPSCLTGKILVRIFWTPQRAVFPATPGFPNTTVSKYHLGGRPRMFLNQPATRLKPAPMVGTERELRCYLWKTTAAQEQSAEAFGCCCCCCCCRPRANTLMGELVGLVGKGF